MPFNNLKELLQKEYSNQLVDLLNRWMSRNTILSPDYATGVEILTLKCHTQGDPPLFNLLLGVSAELTNRVTRKIGIHYYHINMIGVFPLQLVDFKVITIEETSRVSLEDDNIYSLFSLPFIPIEKLEEFADKLRSQCCENIDTDQKHRYFFPIIEVKKKLNLKMWPADLPDNCLGRFYTKVSSATIYDPMYINDPHPNTPIPPGTILLNRNYYINKFSPDDVLTSTHELVHYLIHRPFIAITQYLYAEKNYLECSSEPEILEERMSDSEKAMFYAEWQANDLSIRIVMPKNLVEKAIAEYATNHCKKGAPIDGAYYQDMISELSLSFNVPIAVTKKRLRQLGYDFADGVSTALAADLLIRKIWDKINNNDIPLVLTNTNKHMTTLDHNSVYEEFPESQCLRFPPFSFSTGKLNYDETFVISPESYERLLNENTVFSDLINSGIYIYRVCCVPHGS